MPYTFNVVKGVQRNTLYFQSNLEFGEVAQLVELPEDLLGDQLFDKDLTMQRKLSWTRVRKDMVPYLKNDDAFYSALTLFMVPRDFSKLEEGEGYEFQPFDGNGSDVGRLVIRSTLVLFPADGQHRVASIKELLKENPKMANVTVPVVLVPFDNRGQVRQLFSDLNLNAKPVNKSIGRSFETRDPVALVAKGCEKLIPLFDDRVNHSSNSLPASSHHVITLNTLYEGTDQILEGMGVDVDDLWGLPGNDSAIAGASQKVAEVWQTMIDSLSAWDEVAKGTTKPNEVRDTYVFAHGVGWQALSHVAAAMIEECGSGWKSVFESVLKKVDWSKSNPDWQLICMIGDRMNNTGPGVRATAGFLLQQAGVTTGAAEKYIAQYKKSVSEREEAEAA